MLSVSVSFSNHDLRFLLPPAMEPQASIESIKSQARTSGIEIDTTTAKQIFELCKERWDGLSPTLGINDYKLVPARPVLVPPRPVSLMGGPVLTSQGPPPLPLDLLTGLGTTPKKRKTDEMTPSTETLTLAPKTQKTVGGVLTGSSDQPLPPNLRFPQKPIGGKDHQSTETVDGAKTRSKPVAITVETVPNARFGDVSRPTFVRALVEPKVTADRGPAPEPLCRVRVSTAQTGSKKPGKNHKPQVQKDGAHSRNQGFVDAQKGHIIALQLGGPDIQMNIVPQWANWQANGVWREMERTVLTMAQDAKKKGNEVVFEVQIEYQQTPPKYANIIRLGFPKGFVVKATEQDSKGSEVGWKAWNFNPAQDSTDDKMMYRKVVEGMLASGEGVPDWPDLADVVDADWLKKTLSQHGFDVSDKDKFEKISHGEWPFATDLDDVESESESESEMESSDEDPMQMTPKTTFNNLDFNTESDSEDEDFTPSDEEPDDPMNE